MSRIGRSTSTRASDPSVTGAHENLLGQPVGDKAPITAPSVRDGPLRSRSALGDISAMVSNAGSSVATLGKAGMQVAANAAKTANNTRSGPLASGSTKSLQCTVKTDIDVVPPESVHEVDRPDLDDPQCVAEYVADIYKYFREEEGRDLPSADYLEGQPDVNEKMRGILVDWLVEVHLKYKLKPATLYLAVRLIDRFLERKVISRKRLQLIGVTGMLIAAKYEEIYAPEVRDFVYITDKAYTRDEILEMEILMLNVLEFKLTGPTGVSFLDRFLRVDQADEPRKMLARYLMELTLVDVKFLRYQPSHLAAAALFLANKLHRKHPSWPAPLVRHTRYTETLIKGCAKEICGLLENAERSSLQAVRKKYSLAKFQSVAKITW